MEGRCRSTTSTAWTGLVLMGLSSSRGSGMLRPVSTSWSMCQLTRDTNLMETLKGRSFPPSPGRVTSRSTWGGKRKEEGEKDKQVHIKADCIWWGYVSSGSCQDWVYVCMHGRCVIYWRYTECLASGNGELLRLGACMLSRLHWREMFVWILVCAFVFFPAHPCGCHRQWVSSVQALLSIIDWPAIPEDCHLKVLHHWVNHLPAQHTNRFQLHRRKHV